MLNHATVMGRLTRDPELRKTQSGIPVASFRIACERDYKDKTTGEKVVDFISVTAWRGVAENVAKYFAKGRMAIVEGRLQTNKWTDKDGVARQNIEILADNVYFGDSKRDTSAAPAPTEADASPDEAGGDVMDPGPMDTYPESEGLGDLGDAENGDVMNKLPF